MNGPSKAPAKEIEFIFDRIFFKDIFNIQSLESADEMPRTLNSPVPSKRASNPNADVSLSKPSRSTRTIVRKMTNEVKNPYIDATITIVQ